MKKKNLKNFIGQIFVLKARKDFVDFQQDDYVSLYPGPCLLLLDIIPFSVLSSQLREDAYYSWELQEEYKSKRLKHMASFLNGQQVLYYELVYRETLSDFLYDFKVASNKNINTGNQKQRPLMIGKLKSLPFAKGHLHKNGGLKKRQLKVKKPV